MAKTLLEEALDGWSCARDGVTAELERANQNMMQLSEELRSTEDRVALAGRRSTTA